ncbi:MAG: hypothetical protein H0W89_04920 [Candidatus Levybacteria bacterium]|nr:hypothetical protein [Candidatus Levybacteria bacterium]
MNNKILLESMALDLKRVALGSHSHSTKMAERFLQEVFKRNAMLDTTALSSPLVKVLEVMKKRLQAGKSSRLADDALMYSTLLISFSKKL